MVTKYKATFNSLLFLYFWLFMDHHTEVTMTEEVEDRYSTLVLFWLCCSAPGLIENMSCFTPATLSSCKLQNLA